MSDAVRRFVVGVVGFLAIVGAAMVSAEEVSIKIPDGTARLRTLTSVKEPPVPALRDGAPIAMARDGHPPSCCYPSP
jgi:hypothetical protein